MVLNGIGEINVQIRKTKAHLYYLSECIIYIYYIYYIISLEFFLAVIQRVLNFLSNYLLHIN